MNDKKIKPIKTSTKIFALGILTTIVLIILKLVHIISWDWLWITAPFWGFIVLLIFISLIKSIINDIKVWKRKGIK